MNDEPELKPKLLPCPFCGGEAKSIEDVDDYGIFIKCQECVMVTAIFNHTSVLIKAWNTRTLEQRKRGR